MRHQRSREAGVCAVLAIALCVLAGAAVGEGVPDPRLFFEAASADEDVSRQALERIARAGWRNDYAGLVLDVARFLPRPARPTFVHADEMARKEGPLGGFLEAEGAPADHPRARARGRLIRFLEKQTGKRFGQDLKRWRRWLWTLPVEPHPRYAEFKAILYSAIDPKMASFFPSGVASLIRLDEVDWGGVPVNGIPPLVQPTTVPSREARYLDGRDVVFGISIEGQTRAYPKRILAWHEMILDTVGGVDLAVVYCTLCGTVIPYASEVGGRKLTFGTSGLLYRSNKLMFDEETRSLWSALEGRPVIGPLAGSGLTLKAYPVVTTTWREWVATHPDTTVLALDTGHRRDYAEGAAYREYFSNDRLMFEVPRTDGRLKNKAEVLALRIRPAGAGRDAEEKALAFSVDFLRKKRIHHVSFAGHDLVAVTSPDGANRIYEAGTARFVRWSGDGARVLDDRGKAWEVTESALVPQAGDGPPRPRLPAWRVFWFGWYAQFPDTALIE